MTRIESTEQEFNEWYHNQPRIMNAITNSQVQELFPHILSRKQFLQEFNKPHLAIFFRPLFYGVQNSMLDYWTALKFMHYYKNEDFRNKVDGVPTRPPRSPKRRSNPYIDPININTYGNLTDPF